jgi:hypothetical protein
MFSKASLLLIKGPLARMMLKVETLAIALCVFTLAGLAMYALDILNTPGADHLIQQANAIRRSTNQCYPILSC